MSERALVALAKEAGLNVDWIDAAGQKQSVSQETLRAVLSALGFPADNPAAVHDSRGRLMKEKRAPPKMIVATAGKLVELAARSQRGELTHEHGAKTPIEFRQVRDGVVTFRAPRALGYHSLEVGGRQHSLAVAPARAFQLHGRTWGLAAQLYALRGGRTSGFGDFAALARLARKAARQGADAIAISPIHAGMPGTIEHYSPYSPSSRFVLNPLFAAVSNGAKALDQNALIAWHTASKAKLDALDLAYEQFVGNSRARPAFEKFVHDGGVRLLSHARFEALHARFAASGRTDWRRWPAQYRNANSADSTRLGRGDGDHELERHLFRQWLADRHLTNAQKTARESGMTIGVIADLPVGMDPRGSHAWSAPQELLAGLSIGAPPDALGPDGQDWGLTTLSPFAARADGYASYIATLRASMRHAGGIRIDHAMGMMRLWVIPNGAPSGKGVYLTCPFDDLLRLLILESVRNQSIVIAEDLGTVPPGFRGRIAQAGLLGMRVLFFERDRDGPFKAPSKWDRETCALSTTHDLPTLAGWWRARDLAWRAKISNGFDADSARKSRERDRERLWRALTQSRCAKGPKPPEVEKQVVVDSAIAFIGRTASKLAIVPIEDIAGEIEQPNLPGTVEEHPNWCRRLPSGNGLGTARARRRLGLIARERPRS